jgi:alkyl hydroperoxide reductase subunit AhpC
VGISVDTPTDTARLLEQLEAEGVSLSFPLACDPRRDVVRGMGVYDRDNDISLPAVLILDHEGAVAWKYVGETIVDRAEEQLLIEALGLLSGQGDAAPVDSSS